MATPTVTLYRNSANTTTFVLVSSSLSKTVWKVSGRDLACPWELSIERKLSPGSSKSNDHIIVKVARTERNVSTNLLASASVSMDISVPKDTSILTHTVMYELVAQVASLINDNAAASATTVNRSAITEGCDV